MQVPKKNPRGLAAPRGEPIVKWEGENAINGYQYKRSRLRWRRPLHLLTGPYI